MFGKYRDYFWTAFPNKIIPTAEQIKKHAKHAVILVSYPTHTHKTTTDRMFSLPQGMDFFLHWLCKNNPNSKITFYNKVLWNENSCEIQTNFLPTIPTNILKLIFIYHSNIITRPTLLWDPKRGLMTWKCSTIPIKLLPNFAFKSKSLFSPFTRFNCFVLIFFRVKNIF